MALSTSRACLDMRLACRTFPNPFAGQRHCLAFGPVGTFRSVLRRVCPNSSLHAQLGVFLFQRQELKRQDRPLHRRQVPPGHVEAQDIGQGFIVASLKTLKPRHHALLKACSETVSATEDQTLKEDDGDLESVGFDVRREVFEFLPLEQGQEVSEWVGLELVGVFTRIYGLPDGGGFAPCYVHGDCQGRADTLVDVSGRRSLSGLRAFLCPKK